MGLRGRGDYTLAPAQRDEAGTTIVLHIKPDADEFLEPYRLETIVRKWADHITVPITVARDGKDVAANEGTALWRKPKADVTEEAIPSSTAISATIFDKPWPTLHWRAEGAMEFTALLFVPGSKPFEAVEGERQSQVRLHVRRMFITDDAGLLPAWLRFVSGVVDTEDLPLNVSREMLQATPVLARIRKAVTNRVLSELKTRARTKRRGKEGYAGFWQNFGPVLKEGLWEDQEHRADLAPLLRFKILRRGRLDVAAGLCRPHEAGAGGDLHPGRRRHGRAGEVAAAGGLPRPRGRGAAAGRPGRCVLAGADGDLRGEADPLRHPGRGRPVQAGGGGPGEEPADVAELLERCRRR